MKRSYKKGIPSRSPRTLEDLQKAYQQIAFKLGEAQYLVNTYSAEVKKLSDELLRINNEGADRQRLNAQTEAAKLEVTESKPNE